MNEGGCLDLRSNWKLQSISFEIDLQFAFAYKFESIRRYRGGSLYAALQVTQTNSAIRYPLSPFMRQYVHDGTELRLCVKFEARLIS